MKVSLEGTFLINENMRLVERKSAISTLQVVVNLAVLGAVLSQVVSPIMVKANSSQKIAKNEVISQGKPLPKVNIPFVGNLVKKDLPDKVIKAIITAYTSTPDQTDDSPFIAATGKRVHDGMIAANGLPFGTKIKIPSIYGDKIFVVEDRMNSRYGYGRFDVWLDTTRAEARKFGVKRVEVEIFYPEKKIVKK